MKKTSAYARKRAHLKTVSDHRLAGLTTLARCRPFDEPPAFEFMESISGNATSAMMMINDALSDLLHHRLTPNDDRAYGLLSHAVDVAHIRAIQIQPDEANPYFPALFAAKAAMTQVRQRRERLGTWGLAGPEREPLATAVEIYEAILTCSSPEQMAIAVDIRKEALSKGKVWAPA